jgi:hypothetical protein
MLLCLSVEYHVGLILVVIGLGFRHSSSEILAYVTQHD